ncbi:Peroxidase-like protein 4 [Elsinoe fawcettii]|nr:Peroxidase-like protein 4 [Elsinoe fawcettii]
MKATLVALVANALIVSGQGSFEDWRAPGDGDLRSPCPMLNTLANHGFLPRNGQQITRDIAVKGFAEGLNFDPVFGEGIWQQGLKANPHPNATFWSLGNLQTHDLLEHDASLSRQDQFFGNSTFFNKRTWQQTTRFFTAPTLTMLMIGAARTARKLESKAFNPTFIFTRDAESFSQGEVISFPLLFGDIDKEISDRAQVDQWIRTERLPLELGWKRSPIPLGFQQVSKLTRSLLAAEVLLTDANGGQLPNATCVAPDGTVERRSPSARDARNRQRSSIPNFHGFAEM